MRSGSGALREWSYRATRSYLSNQARYDRFAGYWARPAYGRKWPIGPKRSHLGRDPEESRKRTLDVTSSIFLHATAVLARDCFRVAHSVLQPGAVPLRLAVNSSCSPERPISVRGPLASIHINNELTAQLT